MHRCTRLSAISGVTTTATEAGTPRGTVVAAATVTAGGPAVRAL